MPSSSSQSTAPSSSGANDVSTMPSYSAKPKINIPNFKGQLHNTFTKWHTNFENVLSGAKVSHSEWRWIMNQHIEPGSTAQSMINDYVSRDIIYDKIVVGFGNYFDKLNPIKVLNYFNKISMQKHEDVMTFYLRYNPQCDLMVRFGNLCYPYTHPQIYLNTVNGQFLAKICENLAINVRKELQRLGKGTYQITLVELKEIATREEEDMGGHQQKPNPKPPAIGSFEQQQEQDLLFYYCDSDGDHRIK
mmetsp:Transcript_32002/g.42227  ORF Transcript_32002/g.42227 Transcript_32002/m.42227 type:complete len:247 (-) Transcript_32002:17-757(-)